MNKIITTTIIACITLAYAGAGDAGAAFIKIPVDARVVGMGEASAAYVNNASALYYNPAGLSEIESVDLLFMHNVWLLGMSHEYAALAFAIGNIGTFGLAFNYWGSGSIPVITIRGDSTGNTFSASDWTVNIGYGKDFGSLAFGAGLKYLSEKNEDFSSSAMAFDFGLMYDLPIKGLQTGISLSNLGTSVELDQESFPLPTLIRLGWKYNLQRLGFAQDFIICSSDKFGIALGAEYWVVEIMALRFGYRTGSGAGGLSGLRAGLGVCFKDFGLDYAVAPYGQLGLTHRFSLSFKIIK
jgi:hypothetical protein